MSTDSKKNKEILSKKENEFEINKNENSDLEISHLSEFATPETKKKIRKEIESVKGKLKNLGKEVYNRVEKNHCEHINTFNNFMESVKKDFNSKIQEMENAEKERRKNENIKIIMAEREFFRSEAIRLNKTCKDLNQKLEESRKDIENKDNDIKLMRKKISESEFINKQITQELKRNATYMTELESQIKNTENKYDPFSNENKSEKSQINENPEQLQTDLTDNKITYLNSIIDNLKAQLRKEKMRNTKVIGEVNKVVIDRSNLEKIFIECVEECKKEITLRKIKEKALSKTGSNFNTNDLPTILNSNTQHVSTNTNSIRFEKFLSSDKKKVIESFLMRDEVVNFLHENLFQKKSSDADKEKELMNTKTSLADLKKRTFYSNKIATSTGFSYKIPGTNKKINNPSVNFFF